MPKAKTSKATKATKGGNTAQRDKSQGEADRQLFEDGYLADATIKRGDHEWKVHLVIVTMRSDWFKKAFRGKFTEAETGVVTLEEGEPETIHAMILWLYTQDLQMDERFEDEKTLYKGLVDLYKVADFFGLEELKSQILSTLSERLHKRAALIQYQFCNKTGDQESMAWMTDEAVEGLQAGIAEAYADNYHPVLQIKFLNFVAATFYWCLNDDKFHAILEAVPEFAAPVLKNLAKLAVSDNYFPTRFPTKCHVRNCAMDNSKLGGDVYYGHMIGYNYLSKPPAGYCNKHSSQKITI